eukprot:RCo045484
MADAVQNGSDQAQPAELATQPSEEAVEAVEELEGDLSEASGEPGPAAAEEEGEIPPENKDESPKWVQELLARASPPPPAPGEVKVSMCYSPGWVSSVDWARRRGQASPTKQPQITMPSPSPNSSP